MDKRKKILVISLDGATWKILKPLMDKGIMPYLKSLVDNGASGILKSSTPPVTAPSWASFLTGLWPGKHGIIDFRIFDPHTKSVRFVNSNDLKIDTLWDILSNYKRKFISINVPLTFPPKKINGIMVGGMLSPCVDENIVHPTEIYHRFIKNSDYKITAGRLEKQALLPLDDFINIQIDVEKERFHLAGRLMKEFEWDVMMVHNQTMDHTQHLFYSYLDEKSMLYNEKKYEQISRFYKASDGLIKNLVKQAGEDITVIIISDHGATEVSCFVNLNAWLIKNGYLKFTMKRIMGNVITIIRALDKLNITKRMLAKLIKNDRVIAELSKKAAWNLFDWSRTRAFMINGSVWGNMYCTDGRITEELREKLKNWRDPVSGKKIIKRIYKKGDLFSGPFTDLFPDLFIEPEEGYAFYTPLMKDMRMFCRTDPSNYDMIGTHDSYGIFAINGGNIRKQTDINANIIDIAPTVLYLLGIPIPTYMDGKIIKEVLIKDLPVKYEDKKLKTEGQPRDYSKEEIYAIEQRLEDLGYV